MRWLSISPAGILLSPILIGAFGLAIPAFGQEEPDFGRSGVYVGVLGVGGAYTRFDDELEDQLRSLGYFSANSDTDTAAGYNVFGGYRFARYFAIEAEFESLPEANIDISGAGDVAELETWVLTGNVKVFFGANRLQPYARVGLGVMEAEIKDTVGLGLSDSEADLAIRFGGGLDFYFSQYVAIVLGVDYVVPTGDVEYIDYVSFGGGLQIRF